MADTETKKHVPLRIERLTDGGFLVSESFGTEGGRFCPQLFACSTMGEALNFIAGRLDPGSKVEAVPDAADLVEKAPVRCERCGSAGMEKWCVNCGDAVLSQHAPSCQCFRCREDRREMLKDWYAGQCSKCGIGKDLMNDCERCGGRAQVIR